MHTRRHAGRVRIPVEQVKRHRVLAEHVVVDDIGPDQVIGAQQVECVRHAGAGKVALVLHAAFDPLHLLLVDIDEEIARLLEIHLRGEEGGGIHALIVLRGHPTQ